MLATLRSSVSTLAVLLLPGVGAAEGDAALGNLPDVAIIVGPIDERAAKCNISTSGLDAAVRVTLDDSRLRVTKAPDSSVLFVKVLALRLESGCAAHASLDLLRLVDILSTGKTTVGSVWTRGVILSGPAYDFGERVNASIREGTTEFLAEWIKQNPKP